MGLKAAVFPPDGGTLNNPTFTGAAKFADGTAAAPSIAWTSDADGSGTGLYRDAADSVSVSINGTRRFGVGSTTITVGLGMFPETDLTRALGAINLRFSQVYAGFFGTSAPVTETNATHTVAATTSHLICNRAGTITVTLPAAASFTGRQLTIKTITANTVVSDASNVVPRNSASAGTAILAAAAGNWAMLVSDGTNWICMQGTP